MRRKTNAHVSRLHFVPPNDAYICAAKTPSDGGFPSVTTECTTYFTTLSRAALAPQVSMNLCNSDHERIDMSRFCVPTIALCSRGDTQRVRYRQCMCLCVPLTAHTSSLAKQYTAQNEIQHCCSWEGCSIRLLLHLRSYRRRMDVHLFRLTCNSDTAPPSDKHTNHTPSKRVLFTIK